MEYENDPRSYARHIVSLVRELNYLEKLSIETLKSLGYDERQAKDIIRLSKFLKNIVDSWYRGRIYGGNRPVIEQE